MPAKETERKMCVRALSPIRAAFAPSPSEAVTILHTNTHTRDSQIVCSSGTCIVRISVKSEQLLFLFSNSFVLIRGIFVVPLCVIAKNNQHDDYEFHVTEINCTGKITERFATATDLISL